MRVVVLISGRGSNLQALLRHQQEGGYEIVGVIANRSDAAGLDFASKAGITTRVVAHAEYSERESFDAALAATIDAFRPDLIVLAGFMRILGEPFIHRFRGRMINVHPSLLPDFRGLHTHRRALEAGRSEHGASVHFFTPELDSGPVIAQARIPVLPEDTPETLAARLLPHEHRLLSSVVELIAASRIEWRDGQIFHNGRRLEAPLDLTRA